MANSGALEEGEAAAAAEMKRDLRKVVEGIVAVGEEDVDLEAIDRAQSMLSALREMKLKKKAAVSLKGFDEVSGGGEVASSSAPEEFLCPISREIMRDPVIVSTGQTYDRPFIQKWLKIGNRTCPQTQQVLSHTILTPNHLVREMITQWCKKQGTPLPDYAKYLEENGSTQAERDHFTSLLCKLSSSSSPEQNQAAKELRQLTKKIPSFRPLFGESPDAIPILLAPLSLRESHTDHSDLQEDIITTLLNLSIHDSNKKLVAETPMAIPLLIDALNSGTIETRSNAAATLFTLSALDSNKSLIGKSGAVKSLIDLLDEGNPFAMKDAASAIFSLCIIHENKVRAVGHGAVRVVLNKIINRVNVDELVSILAILSSNQKAVDEMADLGAVPCLLSVIRETSSGRNKENCIAILYTICSSDPSKWREMRQEETTHQTISQLAQNGTSRAKRKASGILQRLDRALSRTHTT